MFLIMYFDTLGSSRNCTRTSQTCTLPIPGPGYLEYFSFATFVVVVAFFRYPQLIPSIMTLFQSVQNLKTILYMSSSVENYKFPVGTKDNPAMTCKELMDIDNIQNGAHHEAMRHHHFKTNIDSTAFSRLVHTAPD